MSQTVEKESCCIVENQSARLTPLPLYIRLGGFIGIFVREEISSLSFYGSIDDDISTTMRNATARFEIGDCPKGSKESRTARALERRAEKGHRNDREREKENRERRKRERTIMVWKDGTLLSFGDACIIVYAT